MKYIFGPVKSRRLGLSLGIDLLPAKICNFNCIYCEVGPTVNLTEERAEYSPTADILAEIEEFLGRDERARAVDVYTITGSGEPTLHTGIGRIIRYLKERIGQPVVVLTNGALLGRPEVAGELAAADIVVPSLDAARPESFRRINRPTQDSDLARIVQGLVDFTAGFSGRVWLEILLARGVNDAPEDIEALKEAVARIKPDRVQLNTVARPPLESFAHPLDHDDLALIAAELSEVCGCGAEILVSRPAIDQDGGRTNGAAIGPSEVLEMLKRRPSTAADICAALHLDQARTAKILTELTRTGRVEIVIHGGAEYFHVLP